MSVNNPTGVKNYLLALVLPLVLLVTTTLIGAGKLASDIEFTEKEIVGVHEIESFYESLIELQRVRGFSYILDIGGADQVDIERDLKAAEDAFSVIVTDRMEESRAVDLRVVAILEHILAEHRALVAAGRNVDSEERFERYTDLINELRLNMVSVADLTNLSIDSENISYYIQRFLVESLPTLTVVMGKYRAVTAAMQDGTRDMELLAERKRFLEYYFNKEIEMLEQRTLGFQYLQESGLPGVAAGYEQDLHVLISGLRVAMKEGANLDHRRGVYQQFLYINDQFEQLVGFYRHSSKVLEMLLKARLEQLSFMYNLVLVFSVVGFTLILVTMYLLFRRNDSIISELTEMREQSEAAKSKLELVLETIPVKVYWKDADGVYLGGNRLFAHDAGLGSLDAVNGKQDADLVWSEHAEQYRDDDLDVLASNQGKYHQEILQHRKNDQDVWLEISKSPLVDGEQKIIGILGCYHNITERKRSEQELHESEIRLRSIFEGVVDGLVTINEEGVVQDFNPAAEKIFGYVAEDVIGKKVNVLMPHDYAANHDGYLASYHETGHSQSILGLGREVEGLRSDGTRFPMELAVSELWIGGRRLYSGIVRDITERKRIDRMKNEFVSTVSHELRTPLTSIRGSLGLALSGVVGDVPAKMHEMLMIASNNTERLLLLINDILDMQKIESGMMSFHFRKQNMEELVKEAVRDNESYARQFNVKFVLQRSLNNVHVFADKDRIIQVMANLLSNAAKFSPKNETIEISLARHKGAVRVSIADHGPGIPEDFQPKLFEKFTQHDASDARQKGGTGLGLSITKAIIDKHGGKLDFVSKMGVGTTFYFELPELLAEIDPAENYVPRKLPDKHQACVLIVEDDPDVAVLIQRMMTHAGYLADIAHSATEARKLLKTNWQRYKLVTLDIQMPDEDGISFLNSLRQSAETRELPVVVVSVKANEAKRELSGGAMGVLDWLSKPIDQARLVNVVKGIVPLKNKVPRILHVEDENDVHRVVSGMLRGIGEIVWATSLASSREEIRNGDYDLVLLDIGLPDGSGLDLLADINKYVRPPRVVIFSAQDVTKEYADQVNAVLVKSKTSNQELYDVLTEAVLGD